MVGRAFQSIFILLDSIKPYGLARGVMKDNKHDENVDQNVIDAFGHEWSIFNYKYDDLSEALDLQFLAYCSTVDLGIFDPKSSIACDFGAGSGRWTSRLLPHFSKVYALEPSDGAHEVLFEKFSPDPRVLILKETVGRNSIPLNSLDFAMSLGVLHHIPNTSLAIKNIASHLKSNGVFLCYLYYNLENKPRLYRYVFKVVHLFRLLISRMPFRIRRLLAMVISRLVYFPFAQVSKLMKRIGRDVSNIPLHHYADMPFVMLANDALDRFGTTLEQRFSKIEITDMLRSADFDISTLKFSEIEPFWTFSVKKL